MKDVFWYTRIIQGFLQLMPDRKCNSQSPAQKHMGSLYAVQCPYHQSRPTAQGGGGGQKETKISFCGIKF